MALQVQLFQRIQPGRPRTDVDEMLCKVYYDAPKGLSMQDLATFLGIGLSTFYDLKRDFPQFSEAIKFYNRVSPIEVLDSLKKLAIGFTAEETTKELKKNGKGKAQLVLTKIQTKHFAPNAQAAMYYLNNQMPEYFKNKSETVITPGENMGSITFTAKRRGE